MFQEKEKQLIKKIMDRDLDFERLTDDDYCLIEDKIGDYYTSLCQKYDEHEDISVCGDILDKLASIE